MATKTEPFDVGDDVTITLTFTDVNNAAADPTAVAVIVQSPSDHKTHAATTTLALGGLNHVSAGVYTFVQRMTEAGLWRVRAVATLAGGLQQVRQKLIEVSTEQVP